MIDFIVNNFSGCVFLAIMLIAMVPSIEGKVAIPFALSVAIWGNLTLSPMVAFICAYLGSTLPCYFVILIVKKIKMKTTGFVQERFFQKFQDRYLKKVQKIEHEPSNMQKLLRLAFFVAVPLPLTGVYSGSIIAGLSNMKTLHSFLAIAFGNFVSCLAILLLCCLFENSALYILIASIIIIAIFFIINFMISVVRRHKKRKEII